jgi:putative hydrolase of the HAD superfamily
VNLKAVTFDAGGTLIKPWPSVGHVYAEAAARHGHARVSPEQLNQRFAAVWKERRPFTHRREEWAALVDRVFEGLVKQPPSETFFPELYDRFGEPEAWRMFDDVLPAIDALAARGISLGIISNWDERLPGLLEWLELRKYFEVVIISCEAGFSKPSPVIFEHAARKLGLAPEFILHVGDDLEDDVAGANSAGFKARLIDRGSGEKREGRIGTLLELEGLV